MSEDISDLRKEIMSPNYAGTRKAILATVWGAFFLLATFTLPERTFADNILELGAARATIQTSYNGLKEDCVPFNPDKIEVKRFRGRWKLVDGKHWLKDFGFNGNEAAKALAIIKVRRFGWICFVGRPYPSLEYFLPKKGMTKVVVVRHAEKAQNNCEAPNCQLSASETGGEKRAETLSYILSVSGITEAFSTQTTANPPVHYLRTFETVNNYAASKGIAIQYYSASGDGPAAVVNKIKTYYLGKSILIAGHSSTVPAILTELGVPDSPLTIGNEFNNLFVVMLPSGGEASMMRLKYEVHKNGN